ncbi:MAG: alpha/beta hydrolase [Patescibacteria group bacterium]
MKKRKFQVQFRGHTLRGDIWGEGVPQVLLLHGAGQSEMSRFKLLREHFARENITTASFDFIGHGKTGGSLKSSSLKNRTEQALAVIKHLKIKELQYLIGCSMSGYTAIRLSEYIKMEKLVLIVPAVYRADVYEVPFGPKFTKMIRAPKSWLESDAWKIVSELRSEILIIAAGKDEVIPKNLPNRLFSKAQKSHDRDIEYVKNASHSILAYFDEWPYLLNSVYSLIREDLYDRHF